MNISLHLVLHYFLFPMLVINILNIIVLIFINVSSNVSCKKL